MKKILYVLIMVATITVVQGVDFTRNINKSLQPYSENFSIDLTSPENSTISITYGNLTSGITTHTLVNSTSWQLNFSMFFSNLQIGNYQEVIDLLNLYQENDTNLTSTNNITIFINILNDSIKNITSLNVSPFIQIDLGKIRYLVCKFTLPQLIETDVTIRGNFNETIIINHTGMFINKTQNLIINNQGTATTTLTSNLNNLSVNLYSETINFYSPGNFSSFIIEYAIKDCLRPYPTFNQCDSVCVNQTDYDGFIRCDLCRKALEIEVNEYVEALRRANGTNNSQEYIIISNESFREIIDRQTIENIIANSPIANQVLGVRTDINNMRTDVTDLKTSTNSIPDNVKEIVERISREIFADLAEKNQNLTLKNKELLDNDKNQNRKIIFFSIVSVVLLGLGYNAYYQKHASMI